MMQAPKTKRETVEALVSAVYSQCPILYIPCPDGAADEIISLAAKQLGEKDAPMACVEFNNALGRIDFATKAPKEEMTLAAFLRAAREGDFCNEAGAFIILRDVAEAMGPVEVALLKNIAELRFRGNNDVTTLIVAPAFPIPRELESYVTVFELPLPTDEEIRAQIRAFAKRENYEVAEASEKILARTLKGMTAPQILQVLRQAYQNDGYLDENDVSFILRAKEQFVKKSGMLEFVNVSGSNLMNESIGGLNTLRGWLHNKRKILENLDKAKKARVPMPNGILIVGMPGCGKSLTAKATASLFRLPLARLDVGRLLGKYVGESEENMRKALRLAEAIAPCVLWVDEIEKAFAGVGGKDESGVTTRLFGQFLTWMQEKQSLVFIVATANDISGLPPEFLRKGRFDELFSVDLPDSNEREQILKIHLRNRGQLSDTLKNTTVKELSRKATEGFNGADLEAAVKEAIEEAFLDASEEALPEEVKVSPKDLENAVKNIHSISETMGERLDAMRAAFTKLHIRSASK